MRRGPSADRGELDLPRWAESHDSGPRLIEGADLKSFLVARRDGERRPLAPGEIFCLPCREPRRPAGGFVEAAPHKGGQWVLSGICPDCDRIIHRYAAGPELGRVAADLEVILTGAAERLEGGSAAPVNVPLREEAHAHV